MNKIILPTKKEALVIEIDSLDKMNIKFLSKIDVSSVERYACIAYKSGGVKAFAMAIKTELKKKEVIADLKQDLEFQICVLKQL